MHPALKAGGMYRREPIILGNRGVGLETEEDFGDHGVPIQHRSHQWRLTTCALLIDISTSIDGGHDGWPYVQRLSVSTASYCKHVIWISILFDWFHCLAGPLGAG
jgi:hypothetical protein